MVGKATSKGYVYHYAEDELKAQIGTAQINPIVNTVHYWLASSDGTPINDDTSLA